MLYARRHINLETCLQCEQVFIRKRDGSFAENFLRALPSIPSSRPLVAIVGAAHQWEFFSRVMSGYYQRPQKYARRSARADSLLGWGGSA